MKQRATTPRTISDFKSKSLPFRSASPIDGDAPASARKLARLGKEIAELRIKLDRLADERARERIRERTRKRRSS